MKRVEGRARDEGGLVFDPQLFDGVEGVGEDDALLYLAILTLFKLRQKIERQK